MSRIRGSLPCQTPAAPLPIRVRPVHGECAGSYLIRMATANRCPPRTMLQLLGRVHHRFRPDLWVELHPQSTNRIVKLSGQIGNVFFPICTVVVCC